MLNVTKIVYNYCKYTTYYHNVQLACITVRTDKHKVTSTVQSHQARYTAHSQLNKNLSRLSP